MGCHLKCVVFLSVKWSRINAPYWDVWHYWTTTIKTRIDSLQMTYRHSHNVPSYCNFSSHNCCQSYCCSSVETAALPTCDALYFKFLDIFILESSDAITHTAKHYQCQSVRRFQRKDQGFDSPSCLYLNHL